MVVDRPRENAICEVVSDSLDAWGWSEGADLPASAYIHIPFCHHRCGYCNFTLLANRSDLYDRFLDALEKELSGLLISRPVQTVFLGGGTPSILPPPQSIRLLAMLGRWLPITSRSNSDRDKVAKYLTEFSIEANPLDVTTDFCKRCKDHGIDRVSIGGQSFQPNKLQHLERDHSPADLRRAIETAKEHFNRVSVDLIFGAPGETLEDWCCDLDAVIAAEIDHVSTYGLTYEKGAKFWSLRKKEYWIPFQKRAN